MEFTRGWRVGNAVIVYGDTVCVLQNEKSWRRMVVMAADNVNVLDATALNT